jgi:CRP-like cAMP-binding protein
MNSEIRPDAPADAPVNPADPYLRRAQTFPMLTDEQVERAAEFGVVQAVPRGTVLFDRGDRGVDFFIVIDGAIEIFETSPSGQTVFARLEKHQFTGELDLFSDRENLVGGRMAATGQVIRTRRAQFRRLLVAEPDIAETIMRAFILRRVGIVEHEQAASTVIGSRSTGDALRLHHFLDRNGYPVRLLDPAIAPEARDTLEARGLGAEDLPVVITAYNQVLRNPSNRALAQAVGMVEPLDPERCSTSPSSAPDRPDSPRPSTAPPKGCARSCSKPRRRADRPAPARRSRTIWASRPASRAACWRTAPRCRHRSSARAWPCRGASCASRATAVPTRSSSTTASACARGRW